MELGKFLDKKCPSHQVLIWITNLIIMNFEPLNGTMKKWELGKSLVFMMMDLSLGGIRTRTKMVFTFDIISWRDSSPNQDGMIP